MTRKAAVSRVILHVDAGRPARRSDRLAGEEPLQISVDGTPLATTMRTPGADFELVAGFLFAEGVVTNREHIAEMRYCASGDAGDFNEVDVTLTADAPGVVPGAVRAFGVTSACGLCGKDTIDAVRARSVYDVAADAAQVSWEVLATLPDALREQQRVFERTGGLHAAGLFDPSGTLVEAREDVGRHNAFDKLVGWALLHGKLPLAGHVLLASGRASFELVQKSLQAGAPVLCSVSAPSSLAVDLAEEAGMTLVGFLRGTTMNVYTGEGRVTGLRRPTA